MYAGKNVVALQTPIFKDAAVADVVVHLGWKEEKAFRKISVMWSGAGGGGRMVTGKEGKERGLRVVLFGAFPKARPRHWPCSIHSGQQRAT